VSELAHPGTAYDVVESEPPEILARNLSAASILLAGATAFFFICFLFAYFYLRALNNAHLWRPSGVDPSKAYGTVIVVLIVVSAVLVRLGLADHRADRREAWRLKGVIALVAGLAALVVQCVAWVTLSFGPADGGYASVYVGWTGFTFLFVLATLYWLETILATSYRYRGWASGAVTVGPGEASGDPHRTGEDIRDPVSLVRAGLGALSFYWLFLAAICVIAWIVLYLV